MTDVSAEMLREKTGQLLERARQGERFRVLREGRPEAFLISAGESVDPEWSEIMAEVWQTHKRSSQKRPNPILQERKAQKYGAHLR